MSLADIINNTRKNWHLTPHAPSALTDRLIRALEQMAERLGKRLNTLEEERSSS